MFKLALVTDTASDLTIKQLEKYQIEMLHYQIIYKDKIYRDQLDITSREVIRNLEVEVPSTSLPPLEEIEQTFDRLKEAGYTHVLVVTLSSGLSGCYNAVRMIQQDYEGLQIYVYDSKTISIAEGMLILKAAELREKGYNLEQIVLELDKFRAKQHTLFIVDTLKYLMVGGRIGHVSGTIGTLLNLKPIITIGEDGKYKTFAKVRGRAKAISTFVKQCMEITSQEGRYNIYMNHGDGEDIKNTIKEQLLTLPHVETFEDWDWISPVACVHAGPGYVGMLIQEI
ncbi:fatty acid-binding protein DegV [Sporanaerobium hydrogeniformans]|uniref:Fatty acid-binding protein DegV n=1 Tax=Sporanaerobium hydrogeniformans TaxID=3072179 RepID=A0AC61DAV1_9FIRM|nr:DegV family protein [Sporanaerobium hydrogeniformans]PHV69868.1 fatty acid-binding protein DegV [Sporanaerobium hydrogeniformans]